jgi:hypothetical protein
MSRRKLEDLIRDISGTSKEQCLNLRDGMPKYAISPLLKNVELLGYHEEGIKWLIHHEKEKEIPEYFRELVSGEWEWDDADYTQ